MIITVYSQAIYTPGADNIGLVSEASPSVLSCGWIGILEELTGG